MNTNTRARKSVQVFTQLVLALLATQWLMVDANAASRHHRRPRASTNTTPVISGTPATTVVAGQDYQFSPVASDAQTTALAFSIRNKPAWATFSISTGRLSGTPTAGAVGMYPNVTISVSDGQTSAALPAFSIVVQAAGAPNVAPVISGVPATAVTVGSNYSFQPTASDANGDTLTFSISPNKPSWATFSAATGRLSGTPGNTNVGTTANIVISVNDGTVTTPLAGFSLTVNAAQVVITGAPRVLYTDLVAGPVSGGENGLGTYLSIFGKNFGGDLNQVHVYLGNTEVAAYRYFGPSMGRSDIQQITVQPGAVGTGVLPIKVVVNGVASNTDQTFRVNPGDILFVDNVNGNDSTGVVGDISHPFRHVQTSSTSAAAYGRLTAGDTIVMRGKGVVYTDVGSSGSYFMKFLDKAGSAPTGAAGTGPITIMGYPGEAVNIVAGPSLSGAISGGNGNGWLTISGLHVEGDGTAGVVNLQIDSDYWRVVNNELTAPHAGAAKAGGITGNGEGSVFLGNHIHNIEGSSGENHGIYVDGEGSYDIGYNDIHDVNSGYGVQAYNDGSNGSSSTSDFSVHHNLIHNIHGKSCINVADASTTGFKIWNNICYSARNSALRFNSNILSGALVYNNTFYSVDTAGDYANDSVINNESGTLTAAQVLFKNNIVWTNSGGSYLGGNGFANGVATNNLWYGLGSTPSEDAHPISTNPLFVTIGSNFHLQTGSPAIDAGSATVSGLVIDDFDTTAARPQGSAYDIGALEK